MRKRNYRRNQRESGPSLGQRLRRGLRRLALLSLVPVLALAGWLAYQSPLFRVNSVSVTGAETLGPTMVAQVSGLEGQNIVQADAAAAKERLAGLPMVKSVSVERRWPGRMLVRIEERHAWGYWQVKEQPYVVDDEGVVLDGVRPDEGAPVIVEADSERRLAPGDRVDADAIALAQRLIESAPKSLRRSVAGLEYSDHAGLTVAFEGGLRAVFGDSRDLDYKLSVLYVLLERAKTQELAVNSVDLRFGENVSFR